MRVRFRKANRSQLALALLLVVLLAGCTLPGMTPPTPTISPAAKTAVAYAPIPSPTERPTPTPSPVPTATPVRPTPTPGKNAFVPTADQPCREVTYRGIVPEQKTTVDTIGQVYHCFLLHYVDHATLDDQVMLNGAWAGVAAGGQDKLAPADLTPPTLTGDREGDWAAFAAQFTALAAKYQGKVDASTLARWAIAGLAASLNDNHVAYLEPKRWRSVFVSELGLVNYPSAGFELAVDGATGKYFLYDVHANTPAARAGLRPGDIIETVGGKPAGASIANQALYDLMVGLPGTGDIVAVSRPASGETFSVLIRVADVSIPLIETGVLPGNIGYIKLRHFSLNSGKAFDQALASLQGRGLKGIIFDVRQNPGGSIDALQHILSHFTHQGPLAVLIDDQGQQTPLDPDPSVSLVNVPWVVLCDGDSASSADITAAVAKDRGGLLIGEKSAGALGAAMFYELADGSALEITVDRVLGPNGEEINNVGVTPANVVPLTPADLSAGLDPQLQSAINALGQR
ncbi:MAG: S41 family peptidase [Thermomicrobiales bacterium]